MQNNLSRQRSKHYAFIMSQFWGIVHGALFIRLFMISVISTTQNHVIIAKVGHIKYYSPYNVKKLEEMKKPASTDFFTVFCTRANDGKIGKNHAWKREISRFVPAATYDSLPHPFMDEELLRIMMRPGSSFSTRQDKSSSKDGHEPATYQPCDQT